MANKKIIYVSDDTEIEIRCTGSKEPKAINWRESRTQGKVIFRLENYQTINFWSGHHPEINIESLSGEIHKQLSVVNNR